MQSSKAFLLLESLISLLLLSLALALFLKFLSSPKELKTLKSTPLSSTPHSLSVIILRSGGLEFEGEKRIWEEGGERWVELGGFR